MIQWLHFEALVRQVSTDDIDTGMSPVATICHKSWGSRPEATSLPPSILLSSLPSRGLPSPGGLDRSRLPAVKHFDAVYTVKQPYK